MEDSRHRVLLVEDNADTREELEVILRALGCDVVSCDNKRTALQHIAEQSFCMALLDLQIFGEAKATKPHEEHGRSLLREIRKVYPHHSGSSFAFPILVVSGYAAEWEAAKELTQDGASDIIRKPPKPGEVSTSVRLHFQRSGRENHPHCATVPGPAQPRIADLCLSVTGVRRGLPTNRLRTEVALGTRSAFLPNRLLKILLHLIKGHLKRECVHSSEMEHHGSGGFKLPYELNKEMRPAFPPNVTAIVENHYHGNYALIESVTIGEINDASLKELDDTDITKLAKEIADLRSKSRNS